MKTDLFCVVCPLVLFLQHIAMSKDWVTVEKCGFTGALRGRILEGMGEQAGKHEFPWMVSLQAKLKSGDFSKNPDFSWLPKGFFQDWDHFCGAAIINRRNVITAKHCIELYYDLRKADVILEFSVLYGGNSLQEMDGENKRISFQMTIEGPGAVFHDDMDFAIVKLADDIPIDEFPPFNVNGICLPTFEKVEAPVELSGWGSTNPFVITIPDGLQKIKFNKVRTVLNLTKASGLKGAMLVTRGGAWTADSGSPLIQFKNNRAFLVGVTMATEFGFSGDYSDITGATEASKHKYGPSQISSNDYIVWYTKVYQLLAWINQNGRLE